MRIRSADPGDAKAIAAVHVRSWQAAYRGVMSQQYLDGLDPKQRYELWEQILRTPDWPRSGVLVAETSEGIIGFVHLRPTRDDDEDPSTVGEITAMYLLPANWSTGVGRQLMRPALKALGDAGYVQATLWVLESNDRARRFYEAGGWRSDGTVRSQTTAGALRRELRYRRAVDDR